MSQHSMALDYRALLKHYMRNVDQHIGSHLLYPRHTTRDENRDDWTEAEWEELMKIQHELDGEISQ